MRPIGLSRGEAEELVEMLESEAGCSPTERQPRPAISEDDWRLRLATDLREQWGMCDRNTEATVRGTFLRPPSKPS